MFTNPKDTVEEFWNINTIEDYVPKQETVGSDVFLEALLSYLNSSGTAYAFSSARIALKHLLQIIRNISKSNKVLLTSFNCPVIPTAVVRAGLEFETFDFDFEFGRINWSKLSEKITGKYCAIVIPHLFGVPTDFTPIIDTCNKHGVFIIEDCAHTLGGKIGTTFAGTIGDASIFSFNYDKPISLGWGGALVVNCRKLIKNTPNVALRFCDYEYEKKELKLFLDSMHNRRKRIGRERFLDKVLFNVFPKQKFEAPTVGFGPLRAALGLWQLERYEDVKNVRNHNSSVLVDKAKKYKCWFVESTVSPAWLKQKILFVLEPEQGLYIAKKLRRCGLRAGNYNWPEAVDNSKNLNSALYAKFSIDIPVHQNLAPSDLDLINTLISNDNSE